VWREALTSDWGKLRPSGLTGSRVADLFVSSLRYIFSTEVHVYAFSIAANAYLAFFPFNLTLLTICRRGLHWEGAYQVVLELLRVHLPMGADSVIRNLVIVVHGRPRLQVMSLLMLFFTSSGVFMPLEVALNKIWGFKTNRNFLKNQVVSFALALLSGLLALGSILVITGLEWYITTGMGWAPAKGLVAEISRLVLEIASLPIAVSIFLAIYYFLPNGKVPFLRVFPAAIVTGILTELGKLVYIKTLRMFAFREVYGPFALSVTLLFWAYVGSLILLFGAHLSAYTFVPNPVPTDAPQTREVGVPSSKGGV
jgi:YihY family inner membrane protein